MFGVGGLYAQAGLLLLSVSRFATDCCLLERIRKNSLGGCWLKSTSSPVGTTCPLLRREVGEGDGRCRGR